MLFRSLRITDWELSTVSHGVALLYCNGMDIKINNAEEDGQYLEYSLLYSVFDFYFTAGPDPLIWVNSK